MKTAAVLCAQGLGDGLLMMIVAHQLKKTGCTPTLFHDQAGVLSPLFEGTSIQPFPSLEKLQPVLASFDLVVLENDNSARAWHLFSLRDQKKLQNMIVFFPTCSKKKTGRDYLFNPQLPVASNLQEGCRAALSLKQATKENGLLLPQDKVHRRFLNRIAIHPTSNDPKRNWLPKQFISLAKNLKNEGFEISFCVSPKERSDWEKVQEEGFSLPLFSDLKDLRDYLFESGFLIGNDSFIGHLASNLTIPTVTISGNPKRVQLWRPDWHLGHVATLPFPLPNFKGIGFKFRENFWQHFISVRRTLKVFQELKKETE